MSPVVVLAVIGGVALLAFAGYKLMVGERRSLTEQRGSDRLGQILDRCAAGQFTHALDDFEGDAITRFRKDHAIVSEATGGATIEQVRVDLPSDSNPDRFSALCRAMGNYKGYSIRIELHRLGGKWRITDHVLTELTPTQIMSLK